MSRRPHEPTDKLKAEVGAYATVGVPHHDIAKLVGIDTKTLLKYYRGELESSKARANAQVGRALFKAATTGGSIPAAIFWMKAQAGWRDRIDMTSDSKPMATINVISGINRQHEPGDG